jgi:hypothetical protein
MPRFRLSRQRSATPPERIPVIASGALRAEKDLDDVNVGRLMRYTNRYGPSISSRMSGRL